MASGQWVPKKTLIDQLRRTMIDGESGVFTILTDKRRSIMFRFSQGKLIHSHCRSRDVEEAVTALSECTELKFSHSGSQPKDQDELMPADAFLKAIAPHELVEEPVVHAESAQDSRPLVDKVDIPAVDGNSGAFRQRVAELDDTAKTTAEPEVVAEEKKAEPEHRLFF